MAFCLEPVEFYRTAKQQGIKPIIGLETYLSARTMQDRDSKLDSRSFHQLLLAENQTGYKNLLKIASASQLEGFYYKPRIDRPVSGGSQQRTHRNHGLPVRDCPTGASGWPGRTGTLRPGLVF